MLLPKCFEISRQFLLNFIFSRYPIIQLKAAYKCSTRYFYVKSYNKNKLNSLEQFHSGVATSSAKQFKFRFWRFHFVAPISVVYRCSSIIPPFLPFFLYWPGYCVHPICFFIFSSVLLLLLPSELANLYNHTPYFSSTL